MSSFGMDACTETFVTLINFMTSMNWSSNWRRSRLYSGLEQSVIDDAMDEWHNVSVRVFMSEEGILSI